MIVSVISPAKAGSSETKVTASTIRSGGFNSTKRTTTLSSCLGGLTLKRLLVRRIEQRHLVAATRPARRTRASGSSSRLAGARRATHQVRRMRDRRVRVAHGRFWNCASKLRPPKRSSRQYVRPRARLGMSTLVGHLGHLGPLANWLISLIQLAHTMSLSHLSHLDSRLSSTRSPAEHEHLEHLDHTARQRRSPTVRERLYRLYPFESGWHINPPQNRSNEGRHLKRCAVDDYSPASA